MGNNRIAERWYAVRVQLTALTLTATQTLPAQEIGANPFIWEELGSYWNATNGDWTIRISDNGGNFFFSADQFPVNCLASVDQRPYELKTPYRFDQGSAIMVEAYNGGGALDTLTLLFIGRRLPKDAV